MTKTHSSITKKQAVLIENENSLFHASKFDSRRLNRPSFLLWLRLRHLVVFGEGIWGCSRCNSAMDFTWVVKLPRLHDGQLWRVFSRSLIHFFVKQVERLRMFIHSDRVKVLYCFVWNYREPGNMYLVEMTMNLLLLFVCLCFTGPGIIRILSRCWRKKYSSKWTLNVGNFL